MEVWKDIDGFEGMYQISTYGNVKSLDRLDNKGRIVHGRILKRKYDGQNYQQVALSKNGKVKYPHIHRLVAEAFIPNPENKATVNHKDEVKENNHVENLEWMTMKENANYGTRKARCYGNRDRNKSIEICRKMGLGNRKPVLQYDKNGNFIKRWDSILLAARGTNISSHSISNVAKGRIPFWKGYAWKYEVDIC